MATFTTLYSQFCLLQPSRFGMSNHSVIYIHAFVGRRSLLCLALAAALASLRHWPACHGHICRLSLLCLATYVLLCFCCWSAQFTVLGLICSSASLRHCPLALSHLSAQFTVLGFPCASWLLCCWSAQFTVLGLICSSASLRLCPACKSQALPRLPCHIVGPVYWAWHLCAFFCCRSAQFTVPGLRCSFSKSLALPACPTTFVGPVY